ncbi:hypothetical protein [Pelomicrobium methylotrophicum]|uniref:hypothetical protein n=1 Tax=Pelomicrobium methylotrophicum TaxID=2602750 RepID=UPI001969A8E9|nr:hypothetical protein [Pelomicrobium methylotrophicum]
MNDQDLKRLFRAIPFAMACDLHQRLKAGCTAHQTRQMLRKALVAAGMARKAR